MSENTGHGRVEKRTCTVVSYGSIMEKMFKKKLVGLEVYCRDKVGENNSSNRRIYSRGQILCNFNLIIPNRRRLHLPSDSIGLLRIIFIGNWMLPFEKTTVKGEKCSQKLFGGNKDGTYHTKEG